MPNPIDHGGEQPVINHDATAALAPRYAVGDLVNYTEDGVISRSPMGEICEVVATGGYRVLWGDDPDDRAGGILLYGDDELVPAGAL
jgi:hypothetical protein